MGWGYRTFCLPVNKPSTNKQCQNTTFVLSKQPVNHCSMFCPGQQYGTGSGVLPELSQKERENLRQERGPEVLQHGAPERETGGDAVI